MNYVFATIAQHSLGSSNKSVFLRFPHFSIFYVISLKLRLASKYAEWKETINLVSIPYTLTLIISIN